MAARKRAARKRPAAAKRRVSGPKRTGKSGAALKVLLPLIFMVGITVGLGFLILMGYRTATASSFFDAKSIVVEGVERGKRSDIENIVNRHSAKSGVWNLDLAETRRDIEELTLVKSAVVSRILPDGIRVNVIERQPVALVELSQGELWVDEEAVVLNRYEPGTDRPPFSLKGWDESKTLNSIEENRSRVKMFTEMLQEWRDFDLVKRVKSVEIRDLRDAKAVIIDSGEPVTISLGDKNFGKGLRDALKAVANKGREIKSYDVQGSVAQPREN
ncbi:MAG: FtsQ-type POTRA domain-containing protein [Pyrinomonadaceae bacterium]|nr:FtsQ-type POTRA domain-containing protein [Pyrinomonadaceae bacterium]